MHINYHVTKTPRMIMGTRQGLLDLPVLKIKRWPRYFKCISTKATSLLIDNKLTFSAHIDNLRSMFSSKIPLLRQLAGYVTTDVLKRFYQGYVLPLIDYGSITWSGNSSANIEHIFKLQKRAVHIILRADFNTSSSAMFTELGWQPVHKRLKYNKAVFIYKALNGLTPEYITSLLRPVAQTHDCRLRSSINGTLAAPRSRSLILRICT